MVFVPKSCILWEEKFQNMEIFEIAALVLGGVLFLWASLDLYMEGRNFSTWDKFCCLLLILFLPIFGPVFYLLLKKKLQTLPW